METDNGNPVKKKVSVNKRSGFQCPKCFGYFLFWEWKAMRSKGYSCQNCGYNFMIGELEFLTAGSELGILIDGRARETLVRKGF